MSKERVDRTKDKAWKHEDDKFCFDKEGEEVMQKLTTQESNYVTDRLMELMGTEVGKEYTDELLIAMLCIQINELEGELATERETTKMSSICDHCATVGCIFQTGIKREKCAFYKNKDDLFCKSLQEVEKRDTEYTSKIREALCQAQLILTQQAITEFMEDNDE